MFSIEEVLLKIKSNNLEHIALLESGGVVTKYSNKSFLSAKPTKISKKIPDWQVKISQQAEFFPSYIGGLQYEAGYLLDESLNSQNKKTELKQCSWWGYYPSGIVWDHEKNTMQIYGEHHIDWEKILATPINNLEKFKIQNFSQDDLDYKKGVRTIQKLIKQGEVYQVNLSRGINTIGEGDPLEVYLRLRKENPSPFMCYLESDIGIVASVSPERLFSCDYSGNLNARPIAGTRKRGKNSREDNRLENDLKNNVKEISEHTMLVDLVRNDIGQKSIAGSVKVPDFMLIEKYSHVMHLVSEVTGIAQENTTLTELLKANFPGGTITGAPKKRVIEAIAELEPNKREWYTGSIGRISNEIDFNILIRTVQFNKIEGKDNKYKITIRSGGGTVIDSDPNNEGQETIYKAKALLNVLNNFKDKNSKDPSQPTKGIFWEQTKDDKIKGIEDKKILLIDNLDSFTLNIAHDFWSLGANLIIKNANLLQLNELKNFYGIIIGPGPGSPKSTKAFSMAKYCLDNKIPVLGICLGHQAIGEALGGKLIQVQPMHGKKHKIQHNYGILWQNIPQNSQFGRYHSLAIANLEEKYIAAKSEDDIIQAIESDFAFSVQFHPESILSKNGKKIIKNWLIWLKNYQK